ncbi:MAG: sulfate reduction electron transfer complex DsrMKJOP subunit DsrM [Elusimicrobia bacterium]|nr:sulfate reduction electron transfer complex DsrMKJOP subunit DsrM [Elusimicrobiota bacterium]
MNALVSLIVVAVLTAVAVAGAGARPSAFVLGIVVPYAAAAVFLLGIVIRVLRWARAPVPFRIPTTCGQQNSLPWVKSSPLDNPHTALGVAARMALEVLCFRSLFRNTRSELRDGPRLIYAENKWLWLGAMTFHWSLLAVVVRHMRFFMEPVPFPVLFALRMDGILEVGVPVVYMSSLGLLAAAGYLLARRLLSPQLRYISLAADYLPLFLILGIAGSGILMRHFTKLDVIAVKELAMGLSTLQPALPEGIGALFFVHLLLVSSLLAYLPFSKLMHLGGVFLSPTRNLANNNRMKRHLNPWNPPVRVHTYEEYEDEFRTLMKGAGLPLEKEPK